MTNTVRETFRLGQSIWYDNIRRGLITSGELQRLIDIGITGLTSNPTIFEKAIAGSADYDDALSELARRGAGATESFEALAIDDIRATADLLRPVYDSTEGADGYASLEISPHLANDTEGSIAQARRLFGALERPNVMVKVPATPAGIPAIRRLIGEGINVNVTLIFSLEAYAQVREAYIGGLEALAGSGGDVGRVASVASFFVSRVDTAVDNMLEEAIRRGREELRSLLGKAAIANAKLAYRDFRTTFQGDRFSSLRRQGARVQRPLWASTGAKNPAYSDVLYLDSLIGPDTVNTVPEATLLAFLEHGSAVPTLEQDLQEAEAAISELGSAGISLEQVTAKLLEDGVGAFADSYDKLLENIEEKKARLLVQAHDHPGVNLGPYLTGVEEALADLQRRDVPCRIWHRDHTVWKEDPTEITDRLGWLTVSDLMVEQIPALQALAEEVRQAGFRHVALLGMGGSSLGPEVLRQSFGSAPGYPELIVLDSTVPAWVQAVTDAIDPEHTLFLVSSKSGSTIEPNSFYAHFRALVEQRVGPDRAGGNFIAITDAGTSLEKLARDRGFRRVFANPPDIGGRYSVLSYFGLVPAALIGMDLKELLDRAGCMREGSASCVAAHDSPGVWLGAALGALSRQGRDKLTLVTSPAIDSYGLWTEQLIAESLGKEGAGIIPVAGEPRGETGSYGNDRFFVYLRLQDDDNSAGDSFIDEVAASGHPALRLDLRDRYDLGAEFFRWEFATAVAGSLLGLHPFDQPNVQAAKDMTDTVLRQYQDSGKLPPLENTGALGELLSGAQPGDYLAIMAYLRQTPELDGALQALRSRVMARYGIATTLGYGPRFLHSTGQLHKGGPNSGLFLQITGDRWNDLPVPGQPFTFGVLNDAQALGDLEALQSAGRRAVRVHLAAPGAEASGIRSLMQELT